jgi:hypothetical protein
MNTNELIMANSQWEALYRKAMTDLKHADNIIIRLSARVKKLERNKPFRKLMKDKRPSVDLFGNIVDDTIVRQKHHEEDENEIPEWLNDTMSFWKMPTMTIDELVDPLDEIGKAQEKYYDSLQAIQNYTTPPSTPTKTTPPKIVRITNKPKKSIYAAIHPTNCICFECKHPF